MKLGRQMYVRSVDAAMRIKILCHRRKPKCQTLINNALLDCPTRMVSDGSVGLDVNHYRLPFRGRTLKVNTCDISFTSKETTTCFEA
jgi:hypothetical protein